MARNLKINKIAVNISLVKIMLNYETGMFKKIIYGFRKPKHVPLRTPIKNNQRRTHLVIWRAIDRY